MCGRNRTSPGRFRCDRTARSRCPWWERYRLKGALPCNFITEPEVTVIVEQINSQKFNILGQVNKPGSYPLSTATTVLDAIAAAGGFRDFAKQKSIYILRQNASGGEARLEFNYKEVIKGKNPQQNIKLEPRDTIVVP